MAQGQTRYTKNRFQNPQKGTQADKWCSTEADSSFWIISVKQDRCTKACNSIRTLECLQLIATQNNIATNFQECNQKILQI